MALNSFAIFKLIDGTEDQMAISWKQQNPETKSGAWATRAL